MLSIIAGILHTHTHTKLDYKPFSDKSTISAIPIRHADNAYYSDYALSSTIQLFVQLFPVKCLLNCLDAMNKLHVLIFKTKIHN